MMIPHKVHWFSLAGLATACLGLVTALFRVAPLWPSVVTAGCAVLVVWYARHAVRGAPVFAVWPPQARRLAVRWITVAALADAAAPGLLDGIGIRRWLAWLTAVTALTGVQIGAAHVLEKLWLHLKPTAAARAASTEVAVIPAAPLVPDHERAVALWSREWDQMNSDEQIMYAVLNTIGYGWLVMCGFEEIRDGDELFGAAFLVRVPAEELAARGDKAVLPASAARAIAGNIGARIRKPIPASFVSIRDQDHISAGLYRITVVTEDVMARIYPYVDPRSRQSIKKPALVGYGIDLKPVHLVLAQHGQYIGKTTSGKTSLVHEALAHATLCAGNRVQNENCVVWICGTMKLYDMVGAWVECYLDTEFDMPFGWVAKGPEHTLLMLVGLMAAARYRQSVPFAQRSWPTILCILDEASFALRNDKVVASWDGQDDLTMSDMAAMNGQGSASANCFLQYATQRDTNDQLGARGGDLAAQMGFTAAFMSEEWASLGRMMGDYKLIQPQHRGEFWLKDSDGSGVRLTKAGYVQTIDPDKPKLHDGDTIADVSWARRLFGQELDEGTANAVAAAVGAVFTERHRKVTPEFIAYLNDGVTARAAADTAPADEVKPTVVGQRREAPLPVDEVCALAQAHGVDVTGMDRWERIGFAQAVAAEFGTVAAFETFLTDPAAAAAPVEDAVPRPPATAVPSPVSTVPAPRIPRVDAMVQVVTDAAAPLRSGDILAALRDAGYVWDDDVACYNQLAKLVASGKLAKDGRLYTVPGRVYAHAGDTR